MRIKYALFLAILISTTAVAQVQPRQAAQSATSSRPTQEGDYVIRNFHFRPGETLPEVRIHYTTLGNAQRDASGRTTNAVLILHGTTGTGHQFLAPQFADGLFGPGQLLDINRYYIVLPDNIGHGKSTKPSDGMHAHFSQYDYADMVVTQHERLAHGLNVNHLRLIIGTSMGCMHSWLWGETYPSDMDAIMALACLPVEIAGRNRMWRKMLMDGIRADPAWKGGDYTSEPIDGLRTAMDLFLIATGAPIPMQKSFSTREAADEYVDNYMGARFRAVQSGAIDANDLWYAFNASREDA
jgi:homoserine O-acetyltransferase